MYKKFLGIIVMLMLSILLILSNQIVNAASFNKRLAGQTRYETAVKIAQEGWTSSDYAVVASGEGFADALSAAPLAKKYDAPMLLTGKDTLDSNTKNELQNLKVKNVFLIGGTSSISDNIKSELEFMNITVTRISGKNRFETSLEVAKNLGDINGIVVTNAYGFADALSIAPIAASQGMAIILTLSDSLSPDTQAFLNSINYSKSYIVGGTGVVGNLVASQLKNVTRLSGTNRYETNSAVLKQFEDNLNCDKVYVASGENYPDALSGSILASKTNSPLILTGGYVDPSTMSLAKSNHDKYNNIIVFGGNRVVSDTMANIICSGIDNTIVTFNDKNLERHIREKINKPTGDIYISDVENITELDCASYDGVCYEYLKITDLNGIENLKNLESLDLTCNHVENLNALKGLSKLKSLEMASNCIIDINGLKDLTNLEMINLYQNGVSDISSLRGLTKLKELYLHRNNISDVSPLKGLVNLKILVLVGNPINNTNLQLLQDALPNCKIN